MADPRVQGIVEFILKEKGLLDASARLKKLESEVNQTRGAMLNLSKAGEAVGAAFRTYLAPAMIFGFLTKATQDWIEFEKRMRAVTEAMRRFGIDTETALPRMQAFFQQIALGTGIVDDETLPAFQKFLNLTGDLEAAMGAVSLAVAVSRSQVIEMGEAADLVADLFGNRWSQAARKLGLDVQALGETAADQAKVIEELRKRLSAYLDEQEKAAGGVARLKSEWDALGDQAGQLGTTLRDALIFPITVLVNWTGKLIQVGRAATLVLTDLWKGLLGGDISDSGTRLAAIFEETSSGVEDVTKNVDKFKQAMSARNLTGEMEDVGKKLGEVLKRAEKEAKEAADAQRKAAEELEKTGDRAAASLRRALQDAQKVFNERKKGLDDLKKLIGDFAEESSEAFIRRLEAEREAEDALRETRIESLEQDAELVKDFGYQMSEERVAQEARTIEQISQLQIAALEAQMRREIAAAEAIGASTAEIRAKYDLLIGANVKASEAAQSKLYAESAAYRREFWLQYVSDSIAAMSAVFGESKAAAIAQAAISTAIGIASIWEHWAWNPPVAGALTALAAMQFMAQVMAIKKANYSGSRKGFDDPMSDREAQFGGRRWAADFVRETTAGFRIGLQEAGLSRRLAAATQSVTNNNSVTNDQSTGQVIHVHGAFIDSDSLRTLGRKLKQVERSDAARFQR